MGTPGQSWLLQRARKCASGQAAVQIALDKRIQCMYTFCMKRTTIFLTPDQIKRLVKIAKRKGINVAQLIRIYINAGLDKDKP
jgi:hypothetical protein